MFSDSHSRQSNMMDSPSKPYLRIFASTSTALALLVIVVSALPESKRSQSRSLEPNIGGSCPSRDVCDNLIVQSFSPFKVKVTGDKNCEFSCPWTDTSLQLRFVSASFALFIAVTEILMTVNERTWVRYSPWFEKSIFNIHGIVAILIFCSAAIDFASLRNGDQLCKNKFQGNVVFNPDLDSASNAECETTVFVATAACSLLLGVALVFTLRSFQQWFFAVNIHHLQSQFSANPSVHSIVDPEKQEECKNGRTSSVAMAKISAEEKNSEEYDSERKHKELPDAVKDHKNDTKLRVNVDTGGIEHENGSEKVTSERCGEVLVTAIAIETPKSRQMIRPSSHKPSKWKEMVKGSVRNPTHATYGQQTKHLNKPTQSARVQPNLWVEKKKSESKTGDTMFPAKMKADDILSNIVISLPSSGGASVASEGRYGQQTKHINKPRHPALNTGNQRELKNNVRLNVDALPHHSHHNHTEIPTSSRFESSPKLKKNKGNTRNHLESPPNAPLSPASEFSENDFQSTRVQPNLWVEKKKSESITGDTMVPATMKADDILSNIVVNMASSGASVASDGLSTRARHHHETMVEDSTDTAVTKRPQ